MCLFEKPLESLLATPIITWYLGGLWLLHWLEKTQAGEAFITVVLTSLMPLE